eukprot:tig00000293_g23890.t1
MGKNAQFLADIRGKPAQELATMANDLSKQLTELRLKRDVARFTGKTVKPSEFGTIRKQIARIYTVLTEQKSA